MPPAPRSAFASVILFVVGALAGALGGMALVIWVTFLPPLLIPGPVGEELGTAAALVLVPGAVLLGAIAGARAARSDQPVRIPARIQVACAAGILLLAALASMDAVRARPSFDGCRYGPVSSQGLTSDAGVEVYTRACGDDAPTTEVFIGTPLSWRPPGAGNAASLAGTTRWLKNALPVRAYLDSSSAIVLAYDGRARVIHHAPELYGHKLRVVPDRLDHRLHTPR